MLLKDWRTDRNRKWTLARLAAALELQGSSPVETVRRWENGESRPDADMVARIETLTRGAVTAADMHVTRLAFLERAATATENAGAAA